MAKSECSDVLKDGTRAVSLYQSRSEYRRLLETRLVTMSYQEAKTDTSLTGTIPIGEVVLGLGFDQKSFDSYKSYLQKDVSLRVDVTRSLDIMLSTGDPEILGAWKACMAGKNGLSVIFEDVRSKSAVLSFQWWAAAGVAKVKISQDYTLPDGVRVVAGQDILSGNQALVAGTEHKVQLAFDSATTTFAMAFNVENVEGGGLAGADSVYLPSRLEMYRESRPYTFPGQAEANFIGVDARRHTGTSASKTYTADSANGWRFVSSSLVVNASVAIPGQIPGTFANHYEVWSGDDQVTVVLGCSSSTGTDIQCHCRSSIQEERWLWRERTD